MFLQWVEDILFIMGLSLTIGDKMKVSTLMTATLLGGALAIFSGCSSDPEEIVEDLLDEVSVYSILLVNDTSSDVTFTGVSRETETQLVSSKRSNSFAFSGGIDISYPAGPTIHFSKGWSGMYVATNCDGKEALHDIEDANNLHVVNLTGAEFAAGSVQIKESDTAAEVVGEQYTNCAITTTSSFNNIVFSYDTMISIDAGNHYKTVRQIDPSFINLGNDMKYYLVAYDDGNISFLPVVKADLNQLVDLP